MSSGFATHDWRLQRLVRPLVISAIQIQDFDDSTYDPFAQIERTMGLEDVDNPYPRLAELCRMGPVHRTTYRESFGLPPDMTVADLPRYMVVGHEPIQRILNDSQTWSNEIYMRNLGRAFGRSITTMDAPEHPKYRRLFQKAFTPAALAKWGRDVVTPVVNQLIDQFVARGQAELVREFTVEYPFRFIYGQLEMPREHVDVFHKLAVGLMCVLSDMEHGLEANRKMGAYFQQLVEERRKHPGADLVSLLATAEVEGERLSNEILISFLRQLLNAAGDTTYRATSTLLVGLLNTPGLLDAVRNDRSLIGPAIEEALRWDAPTLQIYRGPNRDVELGGETIPAGAAVDIVIGSANRDEAVFPNPDRFDIRRDLKTKLLSFGRGPHVCIGQHLARLEINVAMNALLDRLPNLRLDPAYPAPKIVGLVKRSPATVHVRFDQ
jgi:cytochrome P450